MDRSTITASQSTQWINDASIGIKVGAGIAIGFGVQNTAVAEQVGTPDNVTHAVYRLPRGVSMAISKSAVLAN